MPGHFRPDLLTYFVYFPKINTKSHPVFLRTNLESLFGLEWNFRFHFILMRT